MWMEYQLPKSSNKICSAVFDVLSRADLFSYKTICLCSDGCKEQNHNSTITNMCSFFLMNIAPHNIKTIELIFPVLGHSFMSDDRVFCRIEKVLKQMPTTCNPEEYVDVFKTRGTVRVLDEDWHWLESCYCWVHEATREMSLLVFISKKIYIFMQCLRK